MILVTAAIIERNGKILLAKRKKDDPLKDKWEFPGGKMEANESPEACLKRELHEELGIDSKIGAFFCSSKYEYEHIAIELLVYKIESFTGEINQNEHADLAWVAPVDLKSYDMPAADKPVTEMLLRSSGFKK